MLSRQAASGLRGVVHVNGSLAALLQRQSSLLHRGRRSVVERQLPKLLIQGGPHVHCGVDDRWFHGWSGHWRWLCPSEATVMQGRDAALREQERPEHDYDRARRIAEAQAELSKVGNWLAAA